MFKRVRVFALILGAAGVAMTPTAALAQDGYGYHGGDRGYYAANDRNYERQQHREWRDHERQEQRAAEWRENAYRNQEYRGREYREDRRFCRDGDRPAYFYSGYGR